MRAPTVVCSGAGGVDRASATYALHTTVGGLKLGKTINAMKFDSLLGLSVHVHVFW